MQEGYLAWKGGVMRVVHDGKNVARRIAKLAAEGVSKAELVSRVWGLAVGPSADTPEEAANPAAPTIVEWEGNQTFTPEDFVPFVLSIMKDPAYRSIFE